MYLLERIIKKSEESPKEVCWKTWEGSITYGELLERAQGIADELIKINKGKNPVAVLCEKEITSFAAFIGAVISGASYIPVDGKTPQYRIEEIVEASHSEVLINLTERSVHIDGVKSMEVFHIIGGDLQDRRYSLCNDRIFYTIFTSGSTGKPKGVPISYGNLNCYLKWAEELLGDGVKPKFLNIAPFSFDLSVGDTYLALFMGGCFYSLSKEESLNINRVIEFLRENEISIWNSTPSYIEMCLASEEFNGENLPDIEVFTFCGEPFSQKTAQEIMRRFPHSRILNYYGPTEGTVAVTCFEVTKEDIGKYTVLPVGKVNPQCSVLIDNHNENEILISGESIFKGYIGSNNKGVFTHINGVDYYRTGDKGEHIGDILYCYGRLDNQVKVNGYRIELADVATNLAKNEIIDKALVIKDSGGVSECLKAYVKLSRKNEVRGIKIIKGIKEELKKNLPSYMIPRKIVFVEEFPMTSNGKIDIKALKENGNV